jgi:hypothetical protein
MAGSLLITRRVPHELKRRRYLKRARQAAVAQTHGGVGLASLADVMARQSSTKATLVCRTRCRLIAQGRGLPIPVDRRKNRLLVFPST